MIAVGSSRNTPTYKKNGTTPTQERVGRRPPREGERRNSTPGCWLPSRHGLGPVGNDILAGLRRLVTGRDLRRPRHLRKLGGRCGVDRAGSRHRCLADGTSATLEPEVLALVGVEKFLPQPRGRGVRSVLVDGLVVVAADDCVGRHKDLPG